MFGIFLLEEEKDEKMMTLVVVLVVAVTAAGANLLKNGDFERFAGGEPVGWTTNNIPSLLVVVMPSSVSYSGKTAVRCEVKDFHGTAMAGTLTQREIDVTVGELQVKGAYLLRSVGEDVGFISIDVKTSGGSTVAACEHYLPEAKTEFVPFAFTAQLPEEARRIDVLLTLIPHREGQALHKGSYILFDGLELTISSGQEQPQQTHNKHSEGQTSRKGKLV